MTTKISPHDEELLSVYLDGQLAPKERDRLEARLREDAQLRSLLVELRRTRAILRSQPRLRAPRNFTLTPQMVGKPARMAPRGYPALRLASVLAGLLFVLVLVGDFNNGAPPVRLAPAAFEPISQASHVQAGCYPFSYTGSLPRIGR